MISKYKINKFNKLLNKLNLGKIEKIELLESSQNKVYKIYINNKIYVLKEFSKDAISNYYYLKKRKEQIRVSTILNKKGIKTIIPIEYNDKNFIFSNGYYYLIYDYYEATQLNKNELTKEHIKILSKMQSNIHKLNIENKLDCFYHHINIDLEKQLQIAKKVSNDLYLTILENKDYLNEMINQCNHGLKSLKNNLCINHNDYKMLNTLWNGMNLTLIDFDALGLANPTCSLCESAYTFSYNNKIINYEFYKEYLKSYINNYGNIKGNYKEALYVSINGKLQRLEYMFSKNKLKNNNYIDDTINMIKELIIYYKNIDKFNNIFVEVIQQK